MLPCTVRRDRFILGIKMASDQLIDYSLVGPNLGHVWCLDLGVV